MAKRSKNKPKKFYESFRIREVLGFDPLQVHQKCARRTQEPVIYVAGSLFVLVCPLAIASDK